MGIFVRTLIITLVFCLGYFTWVYFSKEAFSPELQITGDAKNIVVQDKAPEESSENQTENKLKDMKVAFLSGEDSIEYVSRKAKNKTLYSALGLLLKGPTDEEKAHGIFTEIPSDTRLISVKKDEAENAIIINLTKEFGEGGGTQSIQARLNQIVKTVSIYAGPLPVYLYLDGKKAQYLGGEGIYIEQPINR